MTFSFKLINQLTLITIQHSKPRFVPNIIGIQLQLKNNYHSTSPIYEEPLGILDYMRVNPVNKPKKPLAFKDIYKVTGNLLGTNDSQDNSGDPSQALGLYNDIRFSSYSEMKYSGRTVATKDDPLKAFYRLNGVLKQNNIRLELKKGRYYEKPSLKRRRLKQELNKSLFQEEISKKVAMLLKLKNRGV